MKSEKDIFDMAESEEILSIEISNTSDILINIIRWRDWKLCGDW